MDRGKHRIALSSSAGNLRYPTHDAGLDGLAKPGYVRPYNHLVQELYTGQADVSMWKDADSAVVTGEVGSMLPIQLPPDGHSADDTDPDRHGWQYRGLYDDFLRHRILKVLVLYFGHFVNGKVLT